AALGRARAKILVVKRIGVGQRAAIVVIKRQLASIDAFRPPEQNPFLRNELHSKTAFDHLSRDRLADFPVFGIPARGIIELHIAALSIARLSEEIDRES